MNQDAQLVQSIRDQGETSTVSNTGVSDIDILKMLLVEFVNDELIKFIFIGKSI